MKWHPSPCFGPDAPPRGSQGKNRGITDAEAKVKNRAYERIKFWLLAENRTVADLDRSIAVDPLCNALSRVYYPLLPGDIAEMIATRRRVLVAKDKRDALARGQPGASGG